VLADGARRAFTNNWEGRHVVLKRTLFTLVYNERGRLGNTRSGKRDGLIVVTPFAGSYLQFDGRDSEEDIVAPDPQRLADLVAEKYRRDHVLDTGTFQKIEPVVVAQYDAGVEFVVRGVRIDRDTVRVFFSVPPAVGRDADVATSLTVKWPTPFSSTFEEGNLVDNLLRQFLTVLVG
jgi:hypothetical protein